MNKPKKDIKKEKRPRRLDEIAALLAELFKKEDEFFSKNKKKQQ